MTLTFVICALSYSIDCDFFFFKSKSAYQFSSNKEKINYLLFNDDLKLYVKNEKGLNSLIQIVQIGMEFRIDKCAT